MYHHVVDVLGSIERFIQSVQPKAPTMTVFNIFDRARLITRGKLIREATPASPELPMARNRQRQRQRTLGCSLGRWIDVVS